MNKIFLIGNLTADPVKTTSGETVITKFSIAVNRRYPDQNGEKAVDYFRITTFGKRAENCSTYLVKGRKVAVTGSLQISEYTDSEGIRRKGIDVIAEEVEFLTPKGENGDNYSREERSDKLEPVDDDSLPF